MRQKGVYRSQDGPVPPECPRAGHDQRPIAECAKIPAGHFRSGPNGSGKSNILDALLFCLGLSSSKGMRAERLPDLVNHDKERRGTVEANVTVTFDLSDLEQPLSIVSSDEQLTSNNSKANENQEYPDEILDSGESTVNDLAASADNHQPTTAQEWRVTRRLRVTKQGSYTSNYYINGEPCTLNELHEQLNSLRIYPDLKLCFLR